MTTWYGFENGTDEGSLTTALIGGYVANGGHFTTDESAHGSMSAVFDASELYHRCGWSLGGVSKVSLAAYVKLSTDVDATSINIMQLSDSSGGRMASVSYRNNNGGAFGALDSGNKTWGNSSIAAPYGSWYRIEVQVDLDAGSGTLTIFDGDSETPLGSKSEASGLDFGAGPFDRLDIGIPAASGLTVGKVYFDAVGRDPGGTAALGPYVEPVPTGLLRGVYVSGELKTASLRGVYDGSTLRTASVREVATTPSQGGDTEVGAWSETNPPWVVPEGESLTDFMPDGVQVLNYDDYAQGTDLGATLTAATNAASGPFILKLNPDTKYHLTSFEPTWANAGSCWFDAGSTKKWCGLLGAGADSTIVEVDADILTSTQLDDISQGKRSPTQYFTLYMSSPPKPGFFSGINFRGNLQQVISLTGLTGTAPAPYEGIHLERLPAGSVVQFCRFQGLGFSAKNSPPYELGEIGSLRSEGYRIRHVEVDGRIAADIDPSQPRASGGIMQNYENGPVPLEQVWLHHTRQTAWAVHEDGTNSGEYDCTDCRFNDLSHRDPTDTWATDGHEMQPIHIEGVTGVMHWKRTRVHTTHATKAHVALDTSAASGAGMASDIQIVDCVSENPENYNGCIVVAIYKENNGNPYWLAYQNGGAAALPITASYAGQTLTAVDVSQFNSSQHFPETHYVIRPT